MKKISKSNNYNTVINSTVEPMTEEEYMKAVEFYKFLVDLTKHNHGILSINREKLIDIAAAYMKCTPLEAHFILRKMKAYGWVKVLDKDFIIVDLNLNI